MMTDKADNLSDNFGNPHVSNAQVAAATACLARHDADDLIGMLGLDQPDLGADPEPAERTHPIHHTVHLGRVVGRRL